MPNNEVLDRLATPKHRARGAPAKKIAVTIYDMQVYTYISEWARLTGTNVSSVLSHCMDIAASTMMSAEGPKQQLITEHTDGNDMSNTKAPRLDDPIPVWLDYLAEYKDIDSYRTDVEQHLRKVMQICNGKYEELAPNHV